MTVRRNKAGQPMKVVELYCPKCGAGLLCSEGEATPPIPGQVPYCQGCLLKGVPVVLRRKTFRSGPIDLHV